MKTPRSSSGIYPRHSNAHNVFSILSTKPEPKRQQTMWTAISLTLKPRSQDLEAMRMGTLPIVAPTGGLKDTVEDRCVDVECGNLGINFAG